MEDKKINATELNENDLDVVTGGLGVNVQQISKECPVCSKITKFNIYSGGRGICTVCGCRIEI